MEEAPENSKESSHSARASEMNEANNPFLPIPAEACHSPFLRW